MNKQLYGDLLEMNSDLMKLEAVRYQFITAECQLRNEIKEKQEINFSGVKGKCKGAGIAVTIYVGVLLLLATIVCHLWVDWFVILIGAAICFALWNSKKAIAILGGMASVAGFAYLIKAFVVDTLIKAVKVGNYVAIIVLTVATVILIATIVLSNRLYVKKANERIQVQNMDIREMNARLYDEINTLLGEEERITLRIQKRLVSNGGFYPDKYAFVDAANFFVAQMEKINGEYTMQQLIDRWEKEKDREYQRKIDEEKRQHRIFVAKSLNDVKDYMNQITQNQETMKMQLHFSNVMSLYNIGQISAIRNQVYLMNQ